MNRTLVAAISVVAVGAIGCSERVVEAGFWFDPIAFDSRQLGGPITALEFDTIERTARAEVISAFNGLRITFSTRTDALYGVRVVQTLPGGGAGESRGITGFGGGGQVSFDFLAVGVFAYTPVDAPRESVIAAIGRAIGRTAVHEFTHQILPTAPIHSTTDLGSYEHGLAVRRQQYYGELHWDLARPLLEARLGRDPTVR